jgi:hypothetical protein
MLGVLPAEAEKVALAEELIALQVCQVTALMHLPIQAVAALGHQTTVAQHYALVALVVQAL